MEITLEILKNSVKMIKPTFLMRSTNLNYRRMTKEVKRLKTKGLIEEILMGEDELKRDARTTIMYQTTAQGIQTMNILNLAIKTLK